MKLVLVALCLCVIGGINAKPGNYGSTGGSGLVVVGYGYSHGSAGRGNGASYGPVVTGYG